MSAVMVEKLHETPLTVTVKVPSVMEADAKVLLVRIESATVESDEGYIVLTDALTQVKRRRDAYEAERVEVKKPVLALGKTLEKLYGAPLAILDSALFIGKQKLLAFDALKKAQAEAQRALDAAAAALALAAEEKLKREAAEAVARAQQASAAASQAAQVIAEAATKEANVDNDKLRKEAITARVAQLKAERVAEAAVAALDTAQVLTQETSALATQATGLVRARGASRRESWQWRVTDFAKIDRKWLMLDEKLINKAVADNKELAVGVLGEGFEVFMEDTIGISGKVRT